MKKIIIFLLIALSLTGCSEEEETLTKDIFAMDTYMSLSATGAQAAELLEVATQTITQIEADISRTDPDSDIYALNHSDGTPVTVSDTTYEILTTALACAVETEGAFDPTICAVTDLWGIGSEDARVPSQEEIDAALATVSYENILLLDGKQVQLLNGAQLDLGAVGKGYAADVLIDLYEAYQLTRGVISLAGNIYVYGEKDDGSLWNIGVTNPDNTTEVSITLQTAQASIVTTGAYERYFEEDGMIYHHVFDSTTGYPTTEDLKSVTVISQNSTIADIYATALFAMGYEEAVAFDETHEDISLILINDQNQVYLSPSIQAATTLGEQYES